MIKSFDEFNKTLKTGLSTTSWSITKEVTKALRSIGGIELDSNLKTLERELRILEIEKEKQSILSFLNETQALLIEESRKIEKLEEDFANVIDNFPHSETLNWWRPQLDFITDTTHVWMFEDGLGTDFGYWMSEKLQVPFDIDKYAEYPMNKFEGSFKLKRTPKLIENLRQLYRKDIERFYPDI